MLAGRSAKRFESYRCKRTRVHVRRIVAMPEKKEKRIFQFELTLLGLLGVGVVCICIFLWMFFLGVWAGQTILLPSQPLNVVSSKDTPSGVGNGQVAFLGGESPSEEQTAASDSSGQENVEDDVETSFFSLQVGAFSSEERARGAANSWVAKGYEAFYQAPSDDGDIYWRTFVGKFNELSGANDEAEKFKDREQVKSFIALVPAAEMRKP